MRIELTPFWWRIIGYVALALLAFLLFRWWLSGRDEKQNLTANVEQATRTSAATTAITQDAASSQQRVGAVEVIVRDSREAYQRGYEDAKRNDPSVAAWSAGDVPQRLRDLARERREQRERSRRDGDGSEGDTPSP